VQLVQSTHKRKIILSHPAAVDIKALRAKIGELTLEHLLEVALGKAGSPRAKCAALGISLGQRMLRVRQSHRCVVDEPTSRGSSPKPSALPLETLNSVPMSP